MQEYVQLFDSINQQNKQLSNKIDWIQKLSWIFPIKFSLIFIKLENFLLKNLPKKQNAFNFVFKKATKKLMKQFDEVFFK